MNAESSVSGASPTVPSPAVDYLTRVAHITSPFITTFLLIHLAAPISANFGGSSLASNVMLLGREYYQTAMGEKLLVLGPLAAHGLSAVGKRVLSPAGHPPRPATSLLTVSGIASVALLTIHYRTHRVLPAIELAPIYEVGPAELDYEFVKTGLARWPMLNTVLYSGLITAVALHVVDGMGILYNVYVRGGRWRGWWPARRKRQIIAGLALVMPVLTGLVFLAREPVMAFPSTVARYEAAFKELILFQ
ncbi:hypothetical protein BD626DRAFT_396909 [Schizophyllum amplum]|uniref:Mitochondrial adapter protein MCP1 transmembrane domain-containing protein n=1 Tax=Schizophyllum amplum TaxID=97359 RepID=A0A550CPU6_9AGAR|nr:hypothetical protein BD626DRAFT_396909 [Auriculariopsis ampla]